MAAEVEDVIVLREKAKMPKVKYIGSILTSEDNTYLKSE